MRTKGKKNGKDLPLIDTLLKRTMCELKNVNPNRGNEML